MDLFGISLGVVIVTTIRLAVPLIIFRWPFWGGVATAIVDAVDVILVYLLQLGDYRSYHQTDKYLDSYFLAFMAFYAWRKWRGLERDVSLVLFIWRMIGFVLFEITGVRWLLLIFPNLFLWWWLWVAGIHRYRPRWQFTRVNASGVLVLMIGPKMIQEMVLHYWRIKPLQVMSDFARNLLEI